MKEDNTNYWIKYFKLENIQSLTELKKKFRELIRKYHPDVSPQKDAHIVTAHLIEVYEFLALGFIEGNTDLIDDEIEEEIKMSKEWLKQRLVIRKISTLKNGIEITEFYKQHYCKKEDLYYNLTFVSSLLSRLLELNENQSAINFYEKIIVNGYRSKSSFPSLYFDYLKAKSRIQSKPDDFNFNKIHEDQTRLKSKLSIGVEQSPLKNLNKTMADYFMPHFLIVDENFKVNLQQEYTITDLGTAGDYRKPDFIGNGGYMDINEKCSVWRIYSSKLQGMNDERVRKIYYKFIIMAEYFVYDEEDSFFVIPFSHFKNKSTLLNWFSQIQNLDDVQELLQTNFFITIPSNVKLRKNYGDWKNIREIGLDKSRDEINIREQIYNELNNLNEEINVYYSIFGPNPTILDMKNAAQRHTNHKIMHGFNVEDIEKKLESIKKKAIVLCGKEASKGSSFKLLADIEFKLAQFGSALQNYLTAIKNYPAYKDRLSHKIQACREALSKMERISDTKKIIDG